jgi:alkane 1-monooxygenase
VPFLGLSLLVLPVLVDAWIGEAPEAAPYLPSLALLPLIAQALHLLCIIVGFVVAARMGAMEALGFSFGAGVCSAFGLNVAHTCGHDRRPLARALSKTMFAWCALPAFASEHNVHHAIYASYEDAATARRGESAYAFAARYVVEAFRTAKRLQTRHTQRLPRLPALAAQHALLLALVALISPVALLSLCGWPSLLVFFVGHTGTSLAVMLVGFYVSHYGLERPREESGKLAPPSATHSWSSSHAGSKYMLLGVSEHAFHHAHPTRGFWCSEAAQGAPRLPLPYAMAVLVALCPPCWRALMEPHLESQGSSTRDEDPSGARRTFVLSERS